MAYHSQTTPVVLLPNLGYHQRHSAYSYGSPNPPRVRIVSCTAPKIASCSFPTGYLSPSYYTITPNSSRYGYVRIPLASVRRSTQRVYMDASDRHYIDSSGAEHPVYILIEPSLDRKACTTKPSTIRTTTRIRTKASGSFHRTQADVEMCSPARPRARGNSSASKPSPTKPSPTKTTKTIRPPRPATAEDALDHGIPVGFCLKNWDPAEKPILLLGSVFDANSLGKWIYDWTVFSHKSRSPLAEMAGELWLLLIQFSGRMQRAEEGIRRVRYKEDKEMIQDFLDSGNRVWRKLKSLIKTCEEAMWEGATKDGSRKVMGQKNGVAFVNTFFGRDYEIDKTERLMTAMRLFNMRFDANCEEILTSLKK